MSNLIDFKQAQLKHVDLLALDILAYPERYLQFDSIADFYQAQWLDDFPKGTTWCSTGLDDGAEHFYAVIEYGTQYLYIRRLDEVMVEYGIRQQGNISAD